MRANILFIAFGFTFMMFAQPPAADVNRVFYLKQTASTQDLMEVATVMRSLAEIRQLATDATQKTMTVTATPAQVEMAEWLFDELVSSGPGRVYRVSDASDDVARVLHLPDRISVQDLQEEATAIRSIAAIRRMFTYNTPRVLAIRGIAGQIAIAEWMAARLMEPSRRGHEYKVAGNENDRIRVMFMSSQTTPQDLQELAVLIRSLGDIRTVITCNTPKAIVVRGTADQAGLASWLFGELAKTASGVTKREYRMAEGGEVARVFYLAQSESPASVQETAVQVRTAAQVRRLFIYHSARALAMRATPIQLDQVEQLLKERSR
jgi:hypothetical protein